MVSASNARFRRSTLYEDNVLVPCLLRSHNSVSRILRCLLCAAAGPETYGEAYQEEPNDIAGVVAYLSTCAMKG